MSRQISIVAARRGRAAMGRQILGSLAATVIGSALLIVHPQIGGGSAAAPVIPPPATPVIAKPEVSSGGARQVIAVGQGTRSNRCDVPGFANDKPVIFEIDTGDPNIADFPSSYVRRLSIKESLAYHEFIPGTRFGKIANTHLRQIRIGSVTWDNPEVSFFSDWDYSFGDDEIPLFGLPGLRKYGIAVEFEGDRCRLTVARNRRSGS
jgi:hypothetical protein